MPCSTSSLFSTRTRTIVLLLDYVGCLLYLVTYVTPSWITYRYDTLTMSLGMFLVCVHSECTTSVQSAGLFRISQVMGTLGLVAYIMFSITATITFFWTKHWRKLKGLKLTAGILAVLAGVFIIVAVLMMKQSKDSVESKLSYSAMLGFVAAAIAFIVSPFYIIDGLTTSKHDVPSDDLRQKRWDRTSPLPVLSNLAPKSTMNEHLSPANPSKIFDDFVQPKPVTSNKSADQNKSDMIRMIREKLAAINKPNELAHDFDRENSFIHPAPKPVGQVVSPDMALNESDDDETFIHPAPNPKGYIPAGFNDKNGNENDELLPNLESYFDPVFSSETFKKGKGKKGSINKKKTFDKAALKSKFNSKHHLDTPVFPSLHKQTESDEAPEIEIPTGLDTFEMNKAKPEILNNCTEKTNPNDFNSEEAENTDERQQNTEKSTQDNIQIGGNSEEKTKACEEEEESAATGQSNEQTETLVETTQHNRNEALKEGNTGTSENDGPSEKLVVKKKIVGIKLDTQKTKPLKKKRKRKDIIFHDSHLLCGDQSSPYAKQSSHSSKQRQESRKKRENRSDSTTKSAPSVTTAPTELDKLQWDPNFVTIPQLESSLTYDLISDSEAE